MELFLIAFLAGILTVLTPCALPILPVILTGSLTTASNNSDKKDSKYKRTRAVFIVLGLSGSVFLFTLLLKASTIFIAVPNNFWQVLSGIIITLFGVFTIFPHSWAWLMQKLNLEHKASATLSTLSTRTDNWGYLLLGAALGPVFTSCSPTYGLIIAAILPTDFITGVIYLIAFCLGLAFILLAVALLGQRLLKNLRWAANPQGLFRKILGIILVLTGIMIMFGLEKKLEAAILQNDLFIETLNVTKIESTLTP